MTETCAAYFRSLGWLSFVWCFVAAYFLFINEHGTWWDRCHVDRFMAPPSSQDKMISATTMFCTEIFVFGLNVFLLLWKPSSQAPSVPASPRSPRSPEHLNQLKKEKYLKERLPFINFPLAYDSLYTILWFVATYMIVVFLKNLLDDPTCSVHPNRYVVVKELSAHLLMSISHVLLVSLDIRAILCSISLPYISWECTELLRRIRGVVMCGTVCSWFL